MLATNVVGWFEIYVQDMGRAKDFYEFVFERRLERLSNAEVEMWSFPGSQNEYGSPGALVKMPGFPSGQNSVLVYFSCIDCAIEELRVKQRGGKVQRSKMSIEQYGYISLVYDTEGNMIGLHSMK